MIIDDDDEDSSSDDVDESVEVEPRPTLNEVWQKNKQVQQQQVQQQQQQQQQKAAEEPSKIKKSLLSKIKHKVGNSKLTD